MTQSTDTPDIARLPMIVTDQYAKPEADLPPILTVRGNRAARTVRFASSGVIEIDAEKWTRMRGAVDRCLDTTPKAEPADPIATTPESPDTLRKRPLTDVTCKYASRDKLQLGWGGGEPYIYTYKKGGDANGASVYLSDADRLALAEQLLIGLPGNPRVTLEEAQADSATSDPPTDPLERLGDHTVKGARGDGKVQVRGSYDGGCVIWHWASNGDHTPSGARLDAAGRAELARLLTVPQATPEPKLPAPATPTEVEGWPDALSVTSTSARKRVILAPITGSEYVIDASNVPGGRPWLNAEQLRQLAANAIDAARRIDNGTQYGN